MADYIAYYGFSEDPFKDTPNPMFFFPAEGHREALLSLQYGINERKGFILLLGERGIGKTTLLHHLMSQADKKLKIAFIHHSNIPYKKMLKEILHQLNIPLKVNLKGSMLHELYYDLIKSLEHDENVAIILDEAHHIGEPVVEEVRLLANLETSTSKLLQIVLCGEPQLRDKLRADVIRQIGQRIVITARIAPMTLEESFQYIDHRLKIVGSEGPRVFTDEAVDAICKEAGGIPRAINILCSNALFMACTLGEEKVSAATVRKIRKEKEFLKGQALRTDRPRIWSSPLFRGGAAAAALLALGLIIYFGWTPLQSILSRSLSPPETRQTVAVHKQADLQTPPTSSVPVVLPAKQEDQTSRATTAAAPADKPVQLPQEKAASERTAPAKQPDTEIQVKAIVEATSGVSLSSLAVRNYRMVNATLLDYMLVLNPSIKNPDLILVNQKIKLPEITEGLLIKQTPEGAFKIHLATFASRSSAAQYSRGIVLPGKTVETVPRQVSEQTTWYRIFAGPYKGWQEASKALSDLKSLGRLPALQANKIR